ncbi:MAG: DUF1844 domain-containing protein [Planctomycetota bacterium]|nr:MAG: DUF1844 domain-containing protein [Planctomycetota bacterium]
MADSQSDESKLVIDEDWKARVEREKREAAEKKAEQPAEAGAGEAGSSAESPADQSSQSESPTPQLPPASFPLLVTSLATQAMVCLGLIPGPDGATAKVDKVLAQHYIDLIAMLEEKTQGNLTPEESKLVADTLYQLRMAFVAVNK